MHAKLYRFIVSRNSKAAWFRARIAGLNKDEPQEAEKQWTFYNAPGMLAPDLVITPSQFEFPQQLT